MSSATTTASPTSPIKAEADSGRYLFSPLIDFLCLGGASLVVLAILASIDNPLAVRPELLFWMLVVANFVNHPHFAHSYQIFYRDFARKISQETPINLRWRYRFAGIIAPAALLMFYSTALFIGNLELIALSINAMLFLVGWHYVKQGYGMLMVDSVLKKSFFSDGEKQLLLLNAYSCWVFGYVFANVEMSNYEMFGVSAYAIPFPEWIEQLTFAIMLAFALATAGMISYRTIWQGKSLPLNGMLAYVTSLYVWLLIARLNPLFIAVIPAFHSLQYLLVVSRFQLNVESTKPAEVENSLLSKWIKSAPVAGLVRFYLLGAVIGYFGFWVLPYLLTFITNTSAHGFPITWAFAVCWTFINVHHYLLDNVMWRRENPEVSKHLFSAH